MNSRSMQEGLHELAGVEMSCGVRVKMSDGEEVTLPLGFHFHPTEEQLVIHYLAPKALDRQLANYYLEELSNPFDRNPLQLTTAYGRGEDREYFFSKQSMSFQEKYSSHGGYWILVSTKKLLAVDGDEEVEAYKAKYLFCYHDFKYSGWKMCVYSLRELKFIRKADVKTDGDNWVVFRVFRQQEETLQHFKFTTGEEQERDEDEDTEQVSSNIVEDSTTELLQADRDSQTDAGDVTPTSSCVSTGVSNSGCSSRRR